MTQASPGLTRRTFLATSAGGVGAALLMTACGKAPTAGTSSDAATNTSTMAGSSSAIVASGSSSAAPSAGKKLTAVGFDYPFTFLPVYAAVTKFAQQHAAELGVELKLTSDNAKLETQVGNLSTLISQKCRRSSLSRWRPPRWNGRPRPPEPLD